MEAIPPEIKEFILNEEGSVTRVSNRSPLIPEIPSNPNSINGVASEDIVLDPNTNLWVRMFIPEQSVQESTPVIVYFHGGGFIVMSSATIIFHNWCQQISKKLGAIVISVNYRLAPEFRLPAAYEDGLHVLRWLQDILFSGNNLPHTELFSCVDSSRIFIMGDSAGGNLTHHATVRAARQLGNLKLAGQVLLQPFFGGEPRTESELKFASGPVITTDGCDFCWRMALPDGADREHEFCNPVSKEGFTDGLPRTLVVVGGKDLLHDRQIEYAKALQGNDVHVKVVEYEDAAHAFYLDPRNKDAHLLLDELATFCN